MNTLEKLFEAIKGAPSPRLKEYATAELVRQLPEFEDHVLYVLRSVYQLLSGESAAGRASGARLLGAMGMFSYTGTQELSAAASEHVYLQAKDIGGAEGGPSRDRQRTGLIKRLKLDHADAHFLDGIELGAGCAVELRTADIEEKPIENVYDFFDAINVLMFSPDWFKRHGALLAYIAIFERIQGEGADRGMEEGGKGIQGDNDANYTDNANNISCINNTVNINNTDNNLSIMKGGRIVITLSPNIFSRIYEILKNDKFNDFVDDQTAAPVRETAARLLRFFYPYINDERLIWILMEFLKSNDWQEQFSGLISLISLGDYLVRSEELSAALLDLLIPLLSSGDEDVKYLSAELTARLVRETAVDRIRAEEIARRCWAEVEDEIDIAHSKATILLLMRDVYARHALPAPVCLSALYPCYTSPLRIIRDAIIALSEIFEGEEVLYLLGEAVLLAAAPSTALLAAAALSRLLDAPSAQPETLRNLASHFMQLLCRDPGLPYSEDDFACYSDAFFLRDGILAIGRDAVLSNRLELFAVLRSRISFTELQVQSCNSLLFDTLSVLFSSSGCSVCSFNDSCMHINNCTGMEGGICNNGGVQGSEGVLGNEGTLGNNNTPSDTIPSNTPPSNTTPTNNTNIPFNTAPNIENKVPTATPSYKEIIIGELNSKFKKYQALKKMPIREFKTIADDPHYSSLYPLCNENALDFFRMVVATHTAIQDYSPYYRRETSEAFLRCVTRDKLATGISLAMLHSVYHLLVAEHQGADPDAPPSFRLNNYVLFFKEFGLRIFYSPFIQTVMADENRSSFFTLLVGFYIKCCKEIDEGIQEDRREGPQEDTHKNVDSTEHFIDKNMKDTNNRFPFDIKTIHTYLDIVFSEALNGKHLEILRCFISDLRYNERIVRFLLKNFDPVLLDGLLDRSNPSFNVLFARLILSNMDTSRSLLSQIIPSLYFSPDPLIAPDLLQLIERSKGDMMMLVDPSRIPHYELACEIAVDLREYQKEGIRWMAFLNRFGLNGILADDMGLGKTVQVLSYMVSEMAKAEGSEEDGDASGGISDINAIHNTVTDKNNSTNTNCLIVCPSSLTTHWHEEITKYFKKDSAVYCSKTRAITSAITIATYDQLRKDTGTLTSPHWFMLVLDEGHLLKSRSTVLYAKASALKATRRFALTGTPVHNSVDDLFSLFNIVMPGYLGTDVAFSATYACKITDKNVDAMEERLAKLQKKILPFVMRRLKSEVLKDLPPKIIKDVVVDLSAEQQALYKSLTVDSQTKDKEALDSNGNPPGQVDRNGSGSQSGYALLRNANALVTTRALLKAAAHPRHFASPIPSSKTAALQEILAMCGDRKVLIFFQLKHTIDYVIDELALPNYLRLDGSIPQSQRGQVVNRFNSENIQYLFLTTSLGGLGLNLVSADTVIFYEHDWNPFNDLQAMDRAHRLGQKRVVNVFRLISRGTIEETVMSYQSFKMYVAASVVTQQNSSVEHMDTKDLMGRFQ